VSVLALAVVALFVVGGASAHITPLTSYTAAFSERGLPSGTTWSVQFNSVTYTSAKSTIYVSGLSGGGYAYPQVVSVTTGVQYAPTVSYTYLYVPTELSQYFIYEKQYEVTLAVSPSTGGSTSPSGSTFYNAGSTFPISAIDAQGYKFSTWTSSSKLDTFGSKTAASTNLTVNATASITAKFKASKYAITYSEVGLPASTTWSVVSGGTTYYSSTSTLTAGTAAPGTLSWSTSPVSVGTGEQYAPSATSGSMSVPDQTSMAFSFVKQYQVTFVASPSGTGTVYPNTAAYYNAGSNVSVYSDGTSTEVFSSWSVSNAANLGLGSKTDAATNVTVRGTGTVTGKFATGTPCTSCTETLYEVGLPVGATWSIGYNGLYYSTVISTTATSISVSGVTGYYFSWSTSQYVSSTGTSAGQAVYITSSTSGNLYVPSELAYTVVYTPEYYLTVQEAPSPYINTGIYPSSGWFPAGSEVPLTAVGSTYWTFSKWASNSTAAPIASGGSAATTVLLNGPASVTATFVQKLTTVSFTEVGLPSGTTWAVWFGSVEYGSSTNTIVIHAVASANTYYSVVSPLPGSASGSEWVPLASNGAVMTGYMSVPYQTLQMVVFQLEYSVDVVYAGTSGGSISPNGVAWYVTGTTIPLEADNGTSATFSSWGVSSSSLVLGSTTQAASYLTIGGTGTVTATFT
jgi:hypothetical protein